MTYSMFSGHPAAGIAYNLNLDPTFKNPAYRPVVM